MSAAGRCLWVRGVRTIGPRGSQLWLLDPDSQPQPFIVSVKLLKWGPVKHYLLSNSDLTLIQELTTPPAPLTPLHLPSLTLWV